MAIKSEAAVLGSILLDGAVGGRIWPEVLELLTPDSFYREAHSIIFRAMLDLNSRNLPCDLILVVEELEQRGQLEEIGGASYLTSLALAPGSWLNAYHYARIVAEKAEARRKLAEAGRLATEAYSPPRAKRRVVKFREVSND
jgi:replicative DNA helicase